MTKLKVIEIISTMFFISGCTGYDDPPSCMEKINISMAEIYENSGTDLMSQEAAAFTTLQQRGNYTIHGKSEGPKCSYKMHISGSVQGNSYDKTFYFKI